MQVCTSLQTDNHASTPPLFITGRMPFLPPNHVDIRRITNQPPLSSVIKLRHLTLFEHLARMDENADASQAIF